MQNVPNIVRERLKVAAPPVNHPDADAITAFSERSLPELERATVLEHLARCAECREIVALALPPSEVSNVRVVSSTVGWFAWPSLRWGFVSAGIVLVAALGFLQYRRGAHSSDDGFSAGRVGRLRLQNCSRERRARQCRPCGCFWSTNCGTSTSEAQFSRKDAGNESPSVDKSVDCAYVRDSCYFLDACES